MSLTRNWLFPLVACSSIAGVLVVGLVVLVFVAGLFYWDSSKPELTTIPTLTAALTVTSTLATTPTATLVSPIIITLPNCYQISFRGFVNNGDGTSTWTYFVEELACAQDLSNWMVELPICARVIGATSSPWELVNPDPNYHLSGIKWQVGAGFTSGEFSVTLSGDLTVGMTTQIGVKGPDIAISTIAGPVCSQLAPTPTLTLIATNAPISTMTMTPTATANITPSPTLMPTTTPTQPPPLPTSPPTPPPPPLPTAPQGSGSPIIINDNNQTRTLTCNGNSITINGNDNTVTLLGSCGAVTIRGNNNWVSIQLATSVTNTGNNNIIVQG
jgi:hypothetical protein